MVFGQGSSAVNFSANTCNNGGLTALSLYNPQGLSIDVSGALFVADANNNTKGSVVNFFVSGPVNDGPLTPSAFTSTRLTVPVAVDVFYACTGGKLPTMFFAPGNPNFGINTIDFIMPVTAPTGPGSIVVSNAGSGGSYAAKSEAVSVPIGDRIIVTGVTQSGSTITVDGAGFSTLTVINLFNAQPGATVNLSGLKADGTANIPLKLVNSMRFTFTRPASAMAGLAFVQALNPPFVPFTSSGTDPCAAFTLK